jgi:hypothetical protein
LDSDRASTFERGISTWLVLVFLLSLPAVTTRIYASDEAEYFAWLRSIAFDRDVNFENEYRYFYETGATKNPSFHETFLEKTNENGLRINFTPIGCAILWAPFYAAGHVFAIASGAATDGLSRPYVASVAYASAVYGLLTLLLSADIARRVVGTGAWATLAVWLGTPILFYMYVAPPMSHATSAFAVTLFLWTWLRVRSRWSTGGAILLGATGALMAMVREQDIFFAAGPALDLLRALTRGRQFAVGTGHSALGTGTGTEHPAPSTHHLLRASAVAAGAFVLVYAPQLWAYKALNGHFGPDSHISNKMSWWAPHGLQVLFSTQYGLFAWTPLALLAFTGLICLARGVSRREADARWIGGLALLMFLLQAYIAGSVNSWTVSGAFGQRRFVCLTPLLTLGLASLFAAARVSRRRWLRPALAGMAALCIWWNLGLMAQFGLNIMNRQRLTLRENAWTTFVTLPPKLPATMWRYFTDRTSFYTQPRQ